LHQQLCVFYPSGSQKVWETPNIIKTANFDIVKEYIRGFYDAEGGCRNVSRYLEGETKSINCEAGIRCVHDNDSNEPLLFIKSVLENNNIKCHLRKDNSGIVITGKSNLKNFYDGFTPSHSYKKAMMKELLSHYLSSADA
jgi:hypothetical protein